MAVTKAWHLRQDGSAFPVNVHLYAMGDDDLSSEADVASFLIKTGSKDIDLAMYVLDAWMALLIENVVDYDADEFEIIETIRSELDIFGPVSSHVKYCLSVDDLINIHKKLNNYTDVDSLYAFVDEVYVNLSNIQDSIRQSMNQQFCRVRFGGKYDSESGNNGIWFRISSVNYNWDNTIYMFVSDMKRQLRIQSITICRDSESDGGFMSSGSDYIYKAKDGSLYFDMPIDEFLSEEHESSPVFSTTHLNSGIIATIRNELRNGNTINNIMCKLRDCNSTILKNLSMSSILGKFVRDECRICCEEQINDLKDKLNAVSLKIVRIFREIDQVNIYYDEYPNELTFEIQSDSEESLDHIELYVDLIQPLSTMSISDILDTFKKEYNRYLHVSK